MGRGQAHLRVGRADGGGVELQLQLVERVLLGLLDLLAGELAVGNRIHALDALSRVTIGDPSLQLPRLNQVVKNFQPRWMTVDEVSSREDARAIAYARSRGARAVMTWHTGSLASAYEEKEERTLWPLIQRNEQGLSGPAVASLGVLIRGRGKYLVFENLSRAFEEVAAGELPHAVQVDVAQAGRWQHREQQLTG